MDTNSGIGGEGQAGLTRIRALFARTDDPYAGADVALARRFAVVMWGFGTLVVFVLNAFFPPTKAFGNGGWVLAGVGALIAAGIMAVLADKRRNIGFDFLFASQFIGLALIAMAQHGAGGRIAPYHELYLCQLIGAGLMHPPRRVMLFLVAVAAASFAPVIYEPSTSEPGEITT